MANISHADETLLINYKRMYFKTSLKNWDLFFQISDMEVHSGLLAKSVVEKVDTG